MYVPLLIRFGFLKEGCSCEFTFYFFVLSSGLYARTSVLLCGFIQWAVLTRLSHPEFEAPH